MTMLDRAFVKAYQQRQQPTGAASSDAAPVVSLRPAESRQAEPPLEDSSVDDLPAEEPVAEELPADEPPKPAPAVARQPAAPSPDADEITPASAPAAVVDAFSHGPALTGKSRILQPTPRRAAYQDVDESLSVTHGGVKLRVRVDRGELPSAPSLFQLGDPGLKTPAEEDFAAPHIDLAPAVHNDRLEPLAPPTEEVRPEPVQPEPMPAEEPSHAEVEALWNAVQAMVDPPFAPGYQVDYLVWPAVCQRMGQKAVQELDQLADALIGYDRRRHRVLGICSAVPGAGATTVSQCLAARLAQAGLKVVVVDAACRAPRLAERFGLVPAVGWEQPVGPARSVADLLVESARDQITVLPRRETGQDVTLTASHLENLAQLRSHYDVVLLDLGSLEETDLAAPVMPALAACLDSLVLVDDARGKHDLTQQAERLRQAGVRELGIVENFAA